MRVRCKNILLEAMLSQASVTSDLRAKLTMYMQITCPQQTRHIVVFVMALFLGLLLLFPGLFSICLVAEMHLMGSDLTKAVALLYVGGKGKKDTIPK